MSNVNRLARAAVVSDAKRIAEIYNQGIDSRLATFETRHRTEADIVPWFERRFPVVVVEEDSRVVAFASASEYRPRDCYSGIAEFSVYVDQTARGRGLGSIALKALITSAESARFWKLVSRVFVSNKASRELLKKLGFREVGVYERHAKLDSVWQDVVIVEFLLSEAVGP